ncbi:tyrosine-type recombinase/integrase [Faucicola boevrei]|uniref:tyrosine-type recombinase/integrase n=1 Tax=Faucicola boevrei TaxID=346665 RepID=UPI000381F704|nr:site-specific integrase [Moraxella boevrei]
MLYQQILAFYQAHGLYQSKHDYADKFYNLSYFEKLDKIKIEHIHEYCTLRTLDGVKNATINRELTVIRSAINYYNLHHETNYHNPFNGFNLFESDFIPTYLTENQCKQLLGKCKLYPNPLFYVYVALLLNTGCRSSELLTLTWDNVDLDRKFIIIRNSLSKNKKTIYKPLNNTAFNLLNNLDKQNEFVFYNPKTESHYKTFRKAWIATLDKLEFKCRIHDLRHTFASLLVSQGVPIYHISQLLGHSDTRITQKYAHLSPNSLSNVVALLPNFD